MECYIYIHIYIKLMFSSYYMPGNFVVTRDTVKWWITQARTYLCLYGIYTLLDYKLFTMSLFRVILSCKIYSIWVNLPTVCVACKVMGRFHSKHNEGIVCKIESDCIFCLFLTFKSCLTMLNLQHVFTFWN